MNQKQMEKEILKKLSKGLLDGPVGDDFVTGGYAKVTFRKIIQDGIPQMVRFGAGSKYFDNKETVKTAGAITKELFDTDEKKLVFFQKYGWLMKDELARAYSALFKGKV